MNTRTLRDRTSSQSAAAPRTGAHADMPAASPQASLPKAAAERLARLGAADMPWLGRDKDAMLTGYNGPEVSGPVEYSPNRVKGRRPNRG